MGICVSLDSSDSDLKTLVRFNVAYTSEYEFFSDSDYAANAEPQNKRKSQCGYVALRNGAPVDWYSTSHATTFSNSRMKEAHADTSAAAAEVYAAGNAVKDILALSYIHEESGFSPFLPAVLRVDNAAAIAFADDSCNKTELKHIDVRQEWVIALRDSDCIVTLHVASKDNLADFYTKILPADDFERLRDLQMSTLVTPNLSRM